MSQQASRTKDKFKVEMIQNQWAVASEPSSKHRALCQAEFSRGTERIGCVYNIKRVFIGLRDRVGGGQQQLPVP